MKKVLFSVAALLVTALSYGQTKFGIVVGPNFSSATTKNSTGLGDHKETSSILAGFRGGVTVDLPLAEDFYIGTGLLYEGKGGKDKDNSNVKTTLSYLQLPVNFLFKPEVGSGKLDLGIGPWLAYGLGGKYKATSGSSTVEYKAFDDGPLKLKRFDAGLGIVVGYEMKMGFNFGLNADLGLVNCYDNTDNDRSWKNTSFGVFVGYKF
jgi:hypothetical protein